MMADWASYAASDFVLFAPRVYERLFEIHNAAWWPAQIVTVAAACVVLLAFLPSRASGAFPSVRVALVVLGAAWVFVGWAWFLERYQTINWAAAYVAPVAIAQGVLLVALAVVGGLGRRREATPKVATWTALAVLAFAVVGYPFVAALSGRPFAAAQVFALTPDPTAIATLGALALARGRWRFLAMAVPVVWTILTGATLAMLGWPDWFVAPALAVLALASAIALAFRS